MRILFFLLMMASACLLQAQHALDTLLPVRGLAIKSPTQKSLDRFVAFIDEELSKMGVNLLILRVEYDYQYQSHPELANPKGLTRDQVKELVAVCRKHDIRLIPQINLLGHQSWHGKIGNLLREYPEFDETPWVALPKGEYKWPNPDGLYCKSYCPRHPEVHKVVFALVDEIIEVFEADAFHAGLDEVFYLAEDKCPRCQGLDKAALFAEEVTRIQQHLAQRGAELWMWGDRLIDGEATGIGMWEASMNQTHAAIDLIPKEVVINDWHYERPDPTAVLFAAKGFRVATCPWRTSDIALKQLEQTLAFRGEATPVMRDRYLGMIQTVWSGPEGFMDQYYGLKANKDPNGNTVACFKDLFAAMRALENK